jgi:formate/nitrite transporter FocA (FNT family)
MLTVYPFLKHGKNSSLLLFLSSFVLSGTDHLIGNASLRVNRASLQSVTCQASVAVMAAHCRVQLSGNLYEGCNLVTAVVSCVVKTCWGQSKAIDRKG